MVGTVAQADKVVPEIHHLVRRHVRYRLKHTSCTGYPAFYWYPVSRWIAGFICRISGSIIHKLVDILSKDS